MSYEPFQLSDRDRKISFTVGSVELEGDLHLPEDARGVVLFAHGSNSSRQSPRNRYIASILQRNQLATFLIDLLTSEETAKERNGHNLLDIDASATRLVGATDWLLGNPATQSLPIGYFGVNRGCGAALVAARQRSQSVSAIVSRGGRPELAGEHLAGVMAPTLLVVGGRDRSVMESNQSAVKHLPSARLALVPGATHQFQEPCALDTVAQLAGEWFLSYLPSNDDFILPASTLHSKVDWV